MGKIKKIKGGFSLFVSDDEKLLVTSNCRNSVYVYEPDTGRLILQTKTVSNVLYKAVSPDKTMLAAKNTQGHIALISMETGEETHRNLMKMREGWQMIFTADGKALLDFDWDGRTMLVDCKTSDYKILDGSCERNEKVLPRTSYMQHDRYSNRIYKFVADKWGNSPGRIMASSADPEDISYEVLQEFRNELPDHMMGISFCKTHNYYADIKNAELIMTDKNFAQVKRIALPGYANGSKLRPYKILVSPCEQYVFIDIRGHYDPDDLFDISHDGNPISWLFKIDTMELVHEFDYDYVSDFTMINDDKKFIVSTWQGTYIGDV